MTLNVGNPTNIALNSNTLNSNTVSNNTVTSNTLPNISVNNNNVTVSNQTAANAIEVLKNMLVGDTFSGEISNINGNELILKMNNGMSFSATLLENSSLFVGQNVTFMINENSNNKISIKSLMIADQEMVIINRALEASNLPNNEKTIQLVKELLKQNMSIDMNTLNNLSKEILKFPNAAIDTVVRLNKLEIPLTEENIKQFEAYKSYEHSISNEMTALSKNFGNFLSTALNKNGIDNALNLSQNFIDILYNKNNDTNNGNSNFSKNITNSTNESNIKSTTNNEMQNNILNSNTININNTNIAQESPSSIDTNAQLNMTSEQINKFISVQSRNELSQNLIEAFGKEVAASIVEDLKKGGIPAKTLLENINELVKNSPNLNKEALDNIFKSKEFSEIINMVVRDKMRIKPEDVKNHDGIKEFYVRVREEVGRLSDVANLADKESSFSKSLEGIKNNIEFMNDLNKNMSYLQLPVKFSTGDAESELYVFTNKKKLSNKTDNLSALLHLDMENLGQLDVFIKLSGKNVSTNFCLENEEMLDFVYDHIDQLNGRLESLGYNVNFEMTVREDNKVGIDFVQDFLDQNKSSTVTSQFLFDTKA